VLDVRGPGLAQAGLYVLTRPGFDPGPVNQAVLDRIPPSERIPGQPPLLYGPTFDFVVPPARPVEGTVREAASGRPVAGARVWGSAGYNTRVEARTDAAGNFRLDGLPKQQELFLQVWLPKGSPLLGQAFTFPDTPGLLPLRANIELARCPTLSGRVTDRATGRPVFADVYFVPLPDNAFVSKRAFAGHHRQRFGSATDLEGRFRFAAMPGSGALVVQARNSEKLDGTPFTPFLGATVDEADREHIRPIDRGAGRLAFRGADGAEREYAPNVVRWLDLPEPTDPPPLDLFLDRGRTATVRVFGPDGRLLTGAVVAGMTALEPTTFTLPGAECTLYALDPAKPRTVVFSHAERKLAGSLSVRGDEAGPLTVRLGPAGGDQPKPLRP